MSGNDGGTAVPDSLARRARKVGVAVPEGPLADEDLVRFAVDVFERPFRWPVPSRERDWRDRGRVHAVGDGAVARLYGDAGPWVVLTHGWDARASQLHAFGEAFLARGWRVAAMDAPGHGDGLGDTCSAPRTARALRGLADQLGGVEGFVGHSFGGAAGLVALGRGWTPRRAALLGAPADLGGLCRNFALGTGLGPALADRFLALLAERVGERLADLRGPDLAGRAVTPGIVVHDPDDRYVPFADAELLARSWPGSRLLPVPGTGHLGMLAAPAVVAAVVDFVTAG